MTAQTKEAPKAAAAKGATKTETTRKTVDNTRMIGGAELASLISIERKARAFNISANRDVKLHKFCNGDFKLPKVFQDNKFKDMLVELGQDKISEKDQKAAALQGIIDSKLDEQVDLKIAEFEGWPLTDTQRTELEAAKVEYREYLSEHVAAAKKMLQELK